MTISRTTTASVSKDRSVSKGTPRQRLLRIGLALGTALTPVALLADTLPTGGTVVGGSAQISTSSPSSMTINQTSDRAVVNWNSFSIGQDSQVNINQPGTNAAILNRVTGDTTSQIHGQLNANGRVFVVNPNGIFIGPTGNVNTGSFVASTLGIRTDDFITGKTVFEGNGSSATVENAGNVQVVTGGYAALIGGKVKNSGTIQAPLGFVGLGSGERITLDLAGDGFLQVAVPTNSEDDGLEALIENSGTIKANGGTVQISAATARNAARHAINLSGVVEARTVSGRNGRITLGGGSGGKVTIGGKVKTRTRPAIQVTQSARPAMRPERGGDITITGQQITLTGADIDASGTDGAGSIRIGGELQGGPGLPRADTLSADAATTIKADAIETGNGGRIIVWSDLETTFAGNLSARGGAQTGDGGFIEVSGKDRLTYRGLADLRAPNGAAGDLLLDPSDIEIVSGTPVSNQIQDSAIEAQLALGNVLVSTANNTGDFPFPDSSEAGTITVVATASVTWTSGNTLTLDSDNFSSDPGPQDIIIGGDITPNDGALVLNAGDRVVVNGDITTTAGGAINVDAGTDFNLAGSGSITAPGSTVSVLASQIDISGTFVAPSSDTTFEASGAVTITSPDLFDANSADVTLEGSDITVDRQLDVTGGVLSVLSGGIFTLTPAGSILGGGTNTRIDADTMTIDGPILTPGGDLRLNAFASTPTIDVGIGGEIDVGQFELVSGEWTQNGLGLGIAPFNADNFVLGAFSSSFLRVLDGDGGATPFELTDVFGLQGVGTVNSGLSNFNLANNIDASGTSGWISLDGPTNGATDGGFAPFSFGGVLEGRGFDISGLTVDRHSQTPGISQGGLFNVNTGLIQNLSVTGASIDGPQVGIIAAQNDGTIDGVSVSGVVRANSTPGLVAIAGGIAGINGVTGTISESTSFTALLDQTDPSSPAPGGAVILSLGGIAGETFGLIERSQAGNTISFNLADTGAAGGIVGVNNGVTNDVYSDASVSGDNIAIGSGAFASVGGIAGENTNSIINALANSPVSLAGTGNAGAVVGTDAPGTFNISSSYFNTDVTGALPSGQNGEVDAGPPGPFQGARGLTTAELQNAQTFFDDASGALWDFNGVWALPQNGVDNSRLYATNLVISAFGEVPDPSFVYTGATTGFTVAGTFGGGPGVFRFGFDGLGNPDTGDVTVLNSQIILSDPNVGPVTYTFPTTFTSDQGLPYDVRSLANPATVTPAPATVTIDPGTKVYGEDFLFTDVSFTPSGFLGAETITDATVVSPGADPTATVAGSPYPLDLTAFVGTGLGNYTITTIPSTLTVTPAPLTLNVNDATKTEGVELIFYGTEFTAIGLLNADTVDSLTITSAGAPAAAPASGSPYSIDGANPLGTGLANYTITINSGLLTVNGAPPVQLLDIFLNNQTKTYGETLNFNGTEFTTVGLQGSDRVDSLTITSDGAAAGAQVADGPFVINGANPIGVGLEDYVISIIPGQLVITPAPLTITADDQTKRAGTEFTFIGNEFIVQGLANDDTVTSATITSDAAAADAPVTGEAGAAILITDPQGTGLENYTITLVNGVFVVAPGNLTITANDQTKVYGTEFVFDGTEFTVEGLEEGDSVDSVTIASAGAAGTAQVADGPFAITITDAVGTGLEDYVLVFADGSFTVIPAPLTVTALDQTKQQGEAFTFNGTEFAVTGLLNDDSVDTAVLTSAGAAAEALAEDSPFDIFVGEVTGSGLTNYDIATVSGSFTVDNLIVPPEVNPVPGGNRTITNPRDNIVIAFPGSEGEAGSVQSGGSGPQQGAQQAEQTLAVVDTISSDLETTIASCGSSDQDFANYMACLSESLDTYSNALDQIASDLPSGLETVSATIRSASASVRASAARAQSRLAGATSEAERQAIRSEAIAEARGAIDEAKEEIRKAITLIRADDPEVENIQQQTGARIIQAFDTVDSELARAVEL